MFRVNHIIDNIRADEEIWKASTNVVGLVQQRAVGGEIALGTVYASFQWLQSIVQ